MSLETILATAYIANALLVLLVLLRAMPISMGERPAMAVLGACLWPLLPAWCIALMIKHELELASYRRRRDG